MLELLEVCRQKELYCMQNDVDDLIESALNSKLFSINLKYQRLDKEKQEVKNIVDQPTKRRARITESLENFRHSDVHQPSKEISIDELKIMMQSYFERMNQLREQEDLLAEQGLLEQEQAAQEKEEPPQNFDIQLEYSLSMGDKHLNTTPKMESDEIIKSSVENLVAIPSEYEESLENFRVIHKKSSISLNNTSQISPVNAITPVLPTEELEYSLSMGDKHLNTTPKTESDEIIKSSVENLVAIPSEYEGIFENTCDVPVCEDSSTFDVLKDHYEILSNSNNDDTSSDDDALRTSSMLKHHFMILSLSA
nr:hypothetical protein [Tanacetum cinerariifolium]